MKMSPSETHNHRRKLFGTMAASHLLGAALARRLGYLRYACYARNSVSADSHFPPPGITVRPARFDEVRFWANCPDLDVPEDFVSSLQPGRDFVVAAYAASDDMAPPMAYAFLSLGTTAIDQRWSIELPADGAYIYKAYVRKEHRGLGLNRVCCRELMALEQAKGRRVFALVEASNMVSRRSFEGLGFSVVGSLLTWSGGTRARLTLGARKAGLHLVSG